MVDRNGKAWHRLRDKTREIGPLYTLRRALWRVIPRSLFTIENVVICEVPLEPLARANEDISGARWGAITDLDALATFGSTTRELNARFARGARPGIVEHGGRVVAWNWSEPHLHDQYDWLRIHLTATDIWSFDGWVSPELRGQRLFPRIKAFMAINCVQDGHTRMLSWIDVLNRNQIHANESLGGHLVGHLFAVRCLGLTYLRLNGASRIGWWGFGRRLKLSVADLMSGGCRQQ